MKKRIGPFLLTFLTAALTLGTATASADYCITGTEFPVQSMSRTYEAIGILGAFDGQTSLSNPQDMFIGTNDKIYIADTGNNRIVVTDKNNTVLAVYGGEYGGKPFNGPQGVFADADGHIFVADTENGRIVHLDPDGVFVEAFVKPDEDTYDASYAFKPAKISIDDMGILYVANAYDYHGLLTLDSSNAFLGYIGATKVGFDLNEWLVRLFASKEQREVLNKQMPPYFSNFFLKDGLIYATSYWDKTNQIKKLSPSGNNIFPSGDYGEKNQSELFAGLPGMVDIAVDGNNIVYTGDLVSGQIYVYDQEGRNLAVFGGSGRREYRFEAISGISVDSKGDLYVLDRISGIVQVFAPTNLMRNIIKATDLYGEGLYEEALEPWKAVMEYDSSGYLANTGVARAAYARGDYREAMRLYCNAFDKKGYSMAFSSWRLDFYRRHFLPVIGVVILAAAGVIILMLKSRKTANVLAEASFCPQERFGPRHMAKTALLMLIHPIDCLAGIKSARNKLKFRHILFWPALLFAVHIAYIYIVHYPLTDLSLLTVDIFQQLALLALPLVSFVLVNFGITSISDGKQTFRETLYASFAAFTPYMLLILPAGALSHLLGLEEKGLYTLLTNGLLLWSVLLLLLSVKLMNEYSFKKLVSTILKTLFAVICVWMIILLFYIILYQTFGFLKNVWTELQIV